MSRFATLHAGAVKLLGFISVTAPDLQSTGVWMRLDEMATSGSRQEITQTPSDPAARFFFKTTQQRVRQNRIHERYAAEAEHYRPDPRTLDDLA